MTDGDVHDTHSGSTGNDTGSAGDDGGNDSKAEAGGGGNSLPAGAGPGVNSVILDAVKQSNATVLGSAGQNGSAIAYQKVSQAAAFSVQDSTDYLRNIMAISSATTGVILKKLVEEPAMAEKYAPVLAAAQQSVIAAQENFTNVGKAAGTVVSGFPSGS